MKYIYLRTTITFLSDIFNAPFNGVFSIIPDSKIQNTENTTSCVSFFENELNNQWLGSIYWMPHDLSDEFMIFADSWFQKNSQNIEDTILFYQATENGILFVDLRETEHSKIASLIQELSNNFSELMEKNSLNYFSHQDVLVLPKKLVTLNQTEHLF